MRTMKIFVISAAAVIGIGGLIYVGPILYEHFGTRYESARREIFEQNKSYVQGTIQNLERWKLEYERAGTQAHKDALREAILSEAAIFEQEHRDEMPVHLVVFIDRLRRGS